MLDMLLIPVLDRVYYYLELPITGTDDIQQHSELRRAYFTLMLSIASAGMSSVFFSERGLALHLMKATSKLTRITQATHLVSRTSSTVYLTT